MQGNYERMIRLAEEAFDVRNDPEQLDVDRHVIERLQMIHAACVSEYADENGPVAWILLIPTTRMLMERFLSCGISEKQLFELTQPGMDFDVVYLCSAMVLEEFRRKGLAKSMTMKALESIRKDHAIHELFVWTFSREGELAARRIAELARLPIRFRETKE